MKRARAGLLVLLLPAIALLASPALHRSARVDAAAPADTPAGPFLRVRILGAADDPRIAAVNEAIVHWNGEMARLGRRVRLDSAAIDRRAVPDDLLRAASGEAVIGWGPATWRLRTRVASASERSDVVVALSGTDLISFGMPWKTGRPGIVAIRRGDVPPLSLPNTLRNVVAHELGHVLGLSHNGDSTTLMCGRPARCRPAAFVSETAHFFPLTPQDERRLRDRWP